MQRRQVMLERLGPLVSVLALASMAILCSGQQEQSPDPTEAGGSASSSNGESILFSTGGSQPVKARRRLAVRIPGGALLGPSREVRVSPVPAGAEIVYHRQGFFFVMDAEGANETRITFDESRTWEHVALSFDRR